MNIKQIFSSLLLSGLAAVATAQTLDGTWKGILEAGPQKLSVALHINASAKEVKMDVVEQGVSNLAMAVSYLSSDSVSMAFSQLAMRYEGKLRDGKLMGIFHQGTFSTPLSFDRGAVVYNRPQEPRPPFPYITKEVTFKNPSAQVTLAGTLTYPEGYKPGEKVPVVLMVTGSGPENRDEEVFHHKPFLVLADYLARQGIASLRYDDRGVGQSTGQFQGATTSDFASDAMCGLDYLRSLRTFSKVGLLGHSEGGAIGYMLGSEGKTDFLVAMAGPACRIDTMMMSQLNAIARSQGATGDVVGSVSEARQLMQRDKSAWMSQFIDLDMRPYVKATRCPVLALGGENDLNVPVSINRPALEGNLPKNKKNVIKVYPGLNHLFQHHPTGNPLDCVNIEETLSPEVMSDIATWIKGL